METTQERPAAERAWSWAGERQPTGAEKWSGYDGRRAVFATLRANRDRTEFAVRNEANGHVHNLRILPGGAVTCDCSAYHGRCWHRSLALHAHEHLADWPPMQARGRECPYCRGPMEEWQHVMCSTCCSRAAYEQARADAQGYSYAY